MKFETIAVHAAGPDEATGAVAPPIHLATTYTRDTGLELIGEFQYGREGGPNHGQLESALARLDGGEAALVFASGMSAGLAILQSLASGDRILLPDDAYYGFRVAARDFLARWGIVSEILDMSDLDALASALKKPTRVVCLETPSNPLLKIVDLRRETLRGWAIGHAIIEGFTDGQRLEVTFRNEYLRARSGDRTLAIVPDLICILDRETGEPITTENLKYGQRVKVVGASVPPIMRSARALEVWGPHAFGFDEPFVPIEEQR